MVVIGLTGGIASGKSTVSDMLSELGAEVVDADTVAKEVVSPGSDAWRELVDEFGEGVLNADGTVSGRRLGRIVFSDRSALERLNRITHPRIIRRIKERIARARGTEAPSRALVVDAPLLIETGLHREVDSVWVVVVDPHTQVERLMARESFSFSEAIDRLEAQMPAEEKTRYADVVIDNRGSVEETRRAVKAAWKRTAARGAPTRGGGDDDGA